MKTIQQSFVDDGVWVRPFGKLIYLMPAFVINTGELKTLTNAVINVISESQKTSNIGEVTDKLKNLNRQNKFISKISLSLLDCATRY